MDEQGVKSIEDVAKFTPGLTFAPSGDGLTNSIAIRGVSSGVGASTTGIYIDDTPIQVRSGTGVVTQNTYPQIFDLDRVEVLRGPQNTLFGTGSMGGTIRFITPEPDLHGLFRVLPRRGQLDQERRSELRNGRRRGWSDHRRHAGLPGERVFSG